MCIVRYILTDTLKKYRKDLKNGMPPYQVIVHRVPACIPLSHISAQKADTEYWENPQMFLCSGEHGPYYRLYSFKATDCLDTKNIRDLKIAGTLRYEVRSTVYVGMDSGTVGVLS